MVALDGEGTPHLHAPRPSRFLQYQFQSAARKKTRPFVAAAFPSAGLMTCLAGRPQAA
jgi:hypothetical protein